MFRIFAIWVVLTVGCSSTPKPTTPAGQAAQLFSQAEEDFEDGLYPEALQRYAEVRLKYPYSKYAALADLRSADTHYERGKYPEAVDAYRNFLKFHPNHDRAPYAMFRIGEAYFEEIPGDWFFLAPSSEKDQASTKLAVTAYQDMVQRFPDNKQTEIAKERLAECRRKLADHELYVAKFYFKRDHYKAAATRAEGLLRDFGGLGLDEDALWIAGKSRWELKEHAEAQKSLARLLKEFPDSGHGGQAKKMLEEQPKAE